MTTLDLISGALKLIGVLSGNEAPTTNEATDAMTALNDMIDSWSIQQLLLFAKVNEVFPLVNNQQSYQMGVGAPDFNTVRPQLIENALWEQNQGSQIFNLSIDIITQDQWAGITVPNTNSPIPTKLFVNYTYPYATLYFWPIPTVANYVQFWSWKPIANFSALGTTVAMPPGYVKAIKYNLALDLAPFYGKTPNALVIAQAVDSKADVKRMNTKPILLGQDTALQSRKAGFNWLTGDTT